MEKYPVAIAIGECFSGIKQRETKEQEWFKNQQRLWKIEKQIENEREMVTVLERYSSERRKKEQADRDELIKREKQAGRFETPFEKDRYDSDRDVTRLLEKVYLQRGEERIKTEQDELQIFINTLQGKTMPIEVQDSDTICSIKTRIHEKEGMPIDQQCLVFNGKQLEDNMKIGECLIKNKAVIYLVLRLRPNV